MTIDEILKEFEEAYYSDEKMPVESFVEFVKYRMEQHAREKQIEVLEEMLELYKQFKNNELIYQHLVYKIEKLKQVKK